MEDGSSGAAGQGGGDAVEAVAQAFGFPAACFVAGQSEEPGPGLQLARQRHDLAPDPVGVEVVEREVGQAGVFRDPDPVLAAGAATMPQFEVLEGAGSGVGRERGESVAVDVVEAQLRAGVGSFPADDHPHPIRPVRQVQQSGELGQIRPFARLAVGVEGRDPDPAGDQVIQRSGVHREGEPHRVGHPAAGEPSGEVFGAAGAVGADQDRLPGPRVLVGQLGEGGCGDGDVIGGGVGAGVPGPQMRHQCFAGPGGSVVRERHQWVEPEPAFERRRGLLLLRMRRDQGGVQVDDQRILNAALVSGGVVPGQGPGPGAGLLPGRADRGHGLVGVLGEGRDQARDGRVRGHRPVDAGLPAQDSDVNASPPSTSDTAKSRMILPGSWTANGLRHRSSASDRPRSRPEARMVSVSRIPPA
ncbi:hypothetical protein SDC9_119108 [bioreactor metagenome]|uniref:Uncharacterized protein n=1 Tax=bioreactor metagenome TaxID=1076179 RepID=A0A645C3L7_9ZZZZ